MLPGSIIGLKALIQVQEFVCLHAGAGQAPQWWRLCYGKVTETPHAFLLFEGRVAGTGWAADSVRESKPSQKMAQILLVTHLSFFLLYSVSKKETLWRNKYFALMVAAGN